MVSILLVLNLISTVVTSNNDTGLSVNPEQPRNIETVDDE